MKMDGEYTLPTNVENVWKNLNDPLFLKILFQVVQN